MSAWQGILSEATDDYSFVLAVAFVLSAVVARVVGLERRRMLGIAALCALHFALLPVAGVLRARGSSLYQDVRLPCLLFAGLAAVGMAGIMVFYVALPRLHLRVPKIVQDVVTGLVGLLVLFGIASRAGYNITGLVATSAVLTAVIGLALQDTLGNIVSGLALQTEDSINVGDWIRMGDKEGRVSEVRWRYTAIETRDWETIFIPNSQLVKERVVVLGRRNNRPTKARRTVYFHVDFRYPANEVIDAVEGALLGSPIMNAAATPPPDCLLHEIGDSYAIYCVRYFMVDLENDAPTDSRVMSRILYGLRRVNIPVSMPAHAIFVTHESDQRKQQKLEQTRQLRMTAIEHVDLLRGLSETERATLASALAEVPFGRGEVLVHQGERGQCLYLLIRGEVAVRVSTDDGLEREVARLGPGDFFGEMSLLTGAMRTATIVALEDTVCYRLDKEPFEAVLHHRPQVADQLAEVLAKRRVELEAAQENLDPNAQGQRLNRSKSDLLGRIRGFFGLKEQSRRPF